MKEKLVKVVEEAGYILDDVIYEKEGSNYFLRVIIDKEGYITINDCITVNNLIDPYLDDLNIKGSYIVDVCSKEKGSV